MPQLDFLQALLRARTAESKAPAGRGVPSSGVARRLHIAYMLIPRVLQVARRALASATALAYMRQ
jgi:hypothetical protein